MIKILEIMNLALSARIFIGDQFSYLQKNGEYEMHLICSPDDKIEDFVKEHHIHYNPIHIERQVNWKKDITAVINISKYIRKNKIDVVIGHQAKGMLLAMLSAAIARVPYKIIMAHGVLVDTQKGLKKWLIVQEEKFIANIANITICVSDSVRRRRLEEKIDKAHKQIIIGNGTCNGVDALCHFNPEQIKKEIFDEIRRKLGLEENDFVIGFCGRLVRDKGVVELIDAFQLIKGKCKNAKLLVIGGYEQRDSIPKETVNILETDKNIIFTGSVDRNIIQYYYAQMDVFVLPSYREGFPTVVLEASSMGIPVVVSKSTGCVDSIEEGKTGLYADINPESIANAVLQLEDKDKAMLMGANGRRMVLDKYEHQIVCKNTLEFFDKLTNNNK